MLKYKRWKKQGIQQSKSIKIILFTFVAFITVKTFYIRIDLQNKLKLKQQSVCIYFHFVIM